MLGFMPTTIYLAIGDLILVVFCCLFVVFVLELVSILLSGTELLVQGLMDWLDIVIKTFSDI